MLESNFEAGDKWYEHEPESDLENQNYKILWDFNIQTDHVPEAQRLALVDKRRTSKFIDFAVPGDSRTQEKKRHKIENIKISRELQKISNVSVDYTISYGLFKCYA